MHVVLYGASGMIGSRILRELTRRGHSVTAVVRHAERLQEMPGVHVLQGDATQVSSIASTAKGCDAAISAYAPPRTEPNLLITAARSLVEGLSAVHVSRLIVVGSAGTLEVSPGVQQMEIPEFPPAWLGVSLAHRDALRVLQTCKADWTFFCPASVIEPGARTGNFRVNGGKMLFDKHGESRISVEDFAMALVNELEHPAYLRQQCTVAY